VTQPGQAGARLRSLLLGRGRAPKLVAGHEVALLQSGAAFFPAVEAAIESARQSVRIETYIFNDDESGRRIALALVRAARRGVRVQVVVDGYGTGVPRGGLARILSGSRVDLRVFRPLARWRFQRQALRRLHRKLALVDEELAFIGGINLIDDHEDIVHGPLDSPRLDFALQVRGPLVIPLLFAMRRVWRRAQPLPYGWWGSASVRSGGTPQSSGHDASLPLLTLYPNVRAAFVERDNWRNRRTIERAYLRAIGAARSEVLIACAYFFPGARFRRALVEAARRGVRVRLLLQGKIEYKIPHFGTLALYEELLRAGIEIIEYRSSFLHAKLALADQWVTVGSSNIDPFSLLLAREANVIAHDSRLASEVRFQLERVIETGGEPVRWSHVLRRPWWMRLATTSAYLALRVGVAVSGRGLRY
jgi:cardiolipin synthase